MTTIHLSLRNPEVPDARDVRGSGDDFVRSVFHPNVEAECIACGKPHDKLWRINRRMMAWGHFGVATINKSEHVIDGSLPTTVDRIPANAIEVSPEDAARVWHEDNESHVFGGPNVAKALRESIARENAR